MKIMELNYMVNEKSIKEKALEIGYEDCGIINISEINDYAEKLNNRIIKFPNTKKFLENLNRFVNLNERFPWAKSIIICVRRYGKYSIPNNLKNRIAKYYLVDGRINEQSADYQASVEFEAFLNKAGLKTAAERKFGITALRWAAFKAGLGIIRQNNFFYTEKSGSWVYLEAWLTDCDMELKSNDKSKPCPNNCNKCIKACPTQSLCEPYTMNRSTCVSCLTTWEGWDMSKESNNHNIGNWIYGCDICQDVCPFNKNKWAETEQFPQLDELAEHISLGKIIEMDYAYLEDVMSSKFFYIGKDSVYKWKTNALNAMLNNYNDGYLFYIRKACNDPNEHVRNMAEWVMGKIGERK
jgi:epoxyqueuosine reductase